MQYRLYFNFVNKHLSINILIWGGNWQLQFSAELTSLSDEVVQAIALFTAWLQPHGHTIGIDPDSAQGLTLVVWIVAAGVGLAIEDEGKDAALAVLRLALCVRKETTIPTRLSWNRQLSLTGVLNHRPIVHGAAGLAVGPPLHDSLPVVLPGTPGLNVIGVGTGVVSHCVAIKISVGEGKHAFVFLGRKTS